MPGTPPTIKRMMLKVKDGTDELVTIVKEQSRGKVTIRNQFGYVDTVSKKDLYEADPEVASFTGTEPGL